MAKEFLTDEQVEAEIKRLNSSEYVKLAREVERLRYKRRQYLYGLRNLEKKGKELKKQGITSELIKTLDSIEELTEEVR